METNDKKAVYALGAIGFGIFRLLPGLGLLLRQIAFQKPGTVYGFVWPWNIDNFLADVQTVCVFIGAVWLIRSGIWGEKPNK